MLINHFLRYDKSNLANVGNSLDNTFGSDHSADIPTKAEYWRAVILLVGHLARTTFLFPYNVHMLLAVLSCTMPLANQTMSPHEHQRCSILHPETTHPSQSTYSSSVLHPSLTCY